MSGNGVGELEAEIGELYAGLEDASCVLSAHLDLAVALERLGYLHCRNQDFGLAANTISLSASQIVIALTLHANIVATAHDQGDERVDTPVWYNTYNDALELAYLGSDISQFGSVVWMSPEVYRPATPGDVTEEGEFSVHQGRLFFRGRHAELERVSKTVGAYLAIIRKDEEVFASYMKQHLSWAESEDLEYARFPTYFAKLAMQYAPEFSLPTDDPRIAWGLLS